MMKIFREFIDLCYSSCFIYTLLLNRERKGVSMHSAIKEQEYIVGRISAEFLLRGMRILENYYFPFWRTRKGITGHPGSGLSFHTGQGKAANISCRFGMK
jgi:hypothetical protein